MFPFVIVEFTAFPSSDWHTLYMLYSGLKRDELNRPVNAADTIGSQHEALTFQGHSSSFGIDFLSWPA